MRLCIIWYIRSLIGLLLLSFSLAVFANPLPIPTNTSSIFNNKTSSTPTFLPADQAFITTVAIQDQMLIVHWDIAEGYYLYRKKFHFSVANTHEIALGIPHFNQASVLKNDDNFGQVEVYKHILDIKIPFTLQAASKIASITVNIDYQGCAEAGLCYPPQTIQRTFLLTHDASTSANKNVSISNNTDTNGLVKFLNHTSLLVALGVFFLLGLGLSFTPCVLPMIPILSSMIAGQSIKNLKPHQGFLLSASYVLGMALAFSAAGLIMGLSGKHIALYLQNPWVISSFALVFILLALSMFGFYELQLPYGLRQRLNQCSAQQKNGRYWGIFTMGVLSALIVSPCVSAPLAGILLYIAQQGDPLIGALSLFMLAIGMGTPLLIIGTTGANLMPKAGPWMKAVKSFFGVLLLAIAVWLLRNLLPAVFVMLLWAALLIIPAIYMGALSKITKNHWGKFWQGLSIMMLCYGILLMVGAAQNHTNPLQPLTHQSANQMMRTTNLLPFHKVTRLAELKHAQQKARMQHKPVMIDFFAEWCIACKEMEHGAFADPQVQMALKNFYLIQVDISNTPDAEALLNTFQLLGPPSILFFNSQGQAIKNAFIMGAMSADVFYQHLNKKVLPYAI